MFTLYSEVILIRSPALIATGIIIMYNTFYGLRGKEVEIMEKMKRNRNRLTALLMIPFMMLGGITVHAEDAADGTGAVVLKLVNPPMNIQVKDEAGNPVNGSEFALYDSSDNMIASWSSGDEANAVCAEGVENRSGAYQAQQDTFRIDFSESTGKKVYGAKRATFYPASVGFPVKSLCSEKMPEDRIIYQDRVLPYDSAYSLDIRYYEDRPTALTVPAVDENGIGAAR